MRSQPRRQKLVETAYELFNKFGYHATGIDLILSKSGVSKATLYKHFPSKDTLILAVLENRHRDIFALVKEQMEAAKGVKEYPVLAIFDVLHAWFNSTEFFGCNFINASSEFSEPTSDIHKCAAQHKNDIQNLMLEYLEEPDETLRESQAEALLLLLDGAIVNAQVRGNTKAALVAKATAIQLLKQH